MLLCIRVCVLHLMNRSVNCLTHVDTNMSVHFVEGATKCVDVSRKLTSRLNYPHKSVDTSKSGDNATMARAISKSGDGTIIEDGFNYGFRIPSFQGSGGEWIDNLQSVRLHPEVVHKAMLK